MGKLKNFIRLLIKCLEELLYCLKSRWIVSLLF
jgi:hypothetical protein